MQKDKKAKNFQLVLAMVVGNSISTSVSAAPSHHSPKTAASICKWE